MTSKISPCLWFDGQAEEAALFYAATFPESRVAEIRRAPNNYPGGKKGDVLTVEFTVLGLSFVGLNAGPGCTFTEAVSLQVFTADQKETDRYWNAIINGGGEESVCGWCKDRFGLSWQIVPKALTDALADPDARAVQRVFSAMMDMRKIDVASIESARTG